jgi:CheY-like chemotaxis protein
MPTFELFEFLNDSLAECKALALQKNIELTIITDFASYISLGGNNQRIKFLLDSILKSTIDNSKATVINFTIRQLLRSEKEILLEFSLEDNGCLSRSPKKFSYLRSFVIVRAVIEELKGKSELMLSPESGSVLKFVISFSLATNPEIVSCKDNLPFLKNKKILIVDDNEMNQQTIGQFLKKEGIDFSIAPDGIKAIELLEQNNVYDLILLDMLMPQMDGFETAVYIRKKLNNSTPIIGMTSKDKAWIPFMCIDAGVDVTINKPFAAEDLLKLINSTLAPSFSTTPVSLMKTA